MNKVSFDGQQEGERVLYEARPDPKAIWLSLASLIAAVVVLVIIGIAIAFFVPKYTFLIVVITLVIGVLIIGAAWLSMSMQIKRNVGFITDRRVIRFTTTLPWSTSSRSLFWDEVVKIKTSTPNWLYKMMNIGYVVVHARQAEDDLDIANVSYFKDLGNYMDKIMYLYKQEPEKLKDVRGFVPKPKGQRY